MTTVVESSASSKQHKPRKASTNKMATLARLRWDGEQSNEMEMREFFNEAPLDKAMTAYASIRKQYELAGELLDKRVQATQEEKCSNCGTVFTRDVRWFHRDPVKDVATGIVRNVFSCSQACFIANKQKTQTGFRKF